MKHLLLFLLLSAMHIAYAQQSIPNDTTPVYCPWLWAQTGNSFFPEAENFGISLGDTFNFDGLVSKDQEPISNAMILGISAERPIIVLIGSGSCPRFRELATFVRDFSFHGPVLNIWVNVLEAHPVDTLCPYRENLGAGPFLGNEPYFSFNQIQKYGEFRERSEYVLGQMSLSDNWIYLVDEPSSRVLSQVVSPAVLLVLDPRSGKVVYELGHPDNVGFTQALQELSLVLGINDQSTSINMIAPNPVTSESRWTGSDQVDIIITDLSGRQFIVSGGNFAGEKTFSGGCYIATVVDQKTGQVIYHQKLIVP